MESDLELLFDLNQIVPFFVSLEIFKYYLEWQVERRTELNEALLRYYRLKKSKIKLNFSHSLKELWWVIQNADD